MSLTSIKSISDLKTFLAREEPPPPPAFEGVPKTLEDGELRNVDVIKAFILYQQEGRFVAHQIESMNNFYDVGIEMIVTQVFGTDIELKDVFDPALDKITVRMSFNSATLHSPNKYTKSGRRKPLYPLEALRTMVTYSAQLSIDIKVQVIGHRKDGGPPMEAEAVKQITAVLPIMVGSNRCNLYKKTSEELAQLGEDPSGRGGYMLIKGIERSLDLQENITFNDMRIFNNLGFRKEWTRCEIISKAGDSYQNSNQMIIRLLVDYQLTISIMHRIVKDCPIPFYLVYRALGMVRDEDVVRSIVTGTRMEQELQKSYDVKYDKFGNATNVRTQQDALQKIAMILSTSTMESTGLSHLDLENHPENMRQAISTVSWILDEKCLPHVGTGPGARHAKLRYLSMMINQTFRTAFNPKTQMDRDAIKNKRYHDSGKVLSKSFKTFLYRGIVRPVTDVLRQQYGKASFASVDLPATIFRKHSSVDFQDEIAKMIVSGDQNSTSSRNVQNTRVSSQQLRRQNELHTLCTQRLISANVKNAAKSKSSSRSNEMRQIQPGMVDRICVIRASSGENIGMVKEQAVFGGVTGISVSSVVIEFVLETERGSSKIFTPLNKISNSEIWERKLACVFVFGKWIGVTNQPAQFANKYRVHRQHGMIGKEVSIYWNELDDQVHFWTDPGRLLTPRLIVFNNKEHPEEFSKDHYKKHGFVQSTRLTPDVVRACSMGQITTAWLIKNRVVELLDSAEEENLILSWSMEHFATIRTDELQLVTHLRVPAQLMGISAHVNVVGNHNQTVRNTFESIQSNQTCGIYVSNWANRMDKYNHVQPLNQVPLLQSMANFLTPPNGVNSMSALMVYDGYNQEDSQIFSRRALAYGMHWGIKLYSYTSERESNESFQIPDPNCMPYKKAQNYSTLTEHGYPEIGTIVHKGDPIIGKVQSTGKDEYLDRSILYDKNKPGIVRDVIKTDNSDGKKFIRVQVAIAMPSKQGEKHSSRAGQKGISGITKHADRMPYTEDGIIPDMLQTPGSQPSRMTIGQMMETVLAKIAVDACVTIDGTTFNEFSPEELYKVCMEKCKRPMISGITGRRITTQIFIGPLYIQRLQKFLDDQLHVIYVGNTNRLTRQGMQGMRFNGGLRLGNMETDVYAAQGSTYAHSEKLRNHCDGYAWALCNTCKKPAVMNTRREYYMCKSCGDSADIKRFETAWTSKLFIQELNGVNVGMQFLTTPPTFQEDA